MSEEANPPIEEMASFSVTSPEAERQFLDEYHQQIDALPSAEDGHYHLDVPLSIETQNNLLLEAGFKEFELKWLNNNDPTWRSAVYAANV